MEHILDHIVSIIILTERKLFFFSVQKKLPTNESFLSLSETKTELTIYLPGTVSAGDTNAKLYALLAGNRTYTVVITYEYGRVALNFTIRATDIVKLGK